MNLRTRIRRWLHRRSKRYIPSPWDGAIVRERRYFVANWNSSVGRQLRR